VWGTVTVRWGGLTGQGHRLGTGAGTSGGDTRALAWHRRNGIGGLWRRIRWVEATGMFIGYMG